MMNEQESRSSSAATHTLSILMLSLDIFLLGIIVWITTLVRCRFEAIFHDFGAQLPIITTLLLFVPGKVYAMTATCFGFLLLVKEYTISKQSLKLAINLVAGVALLAFTALFPLAMLLPWMSLIQNLE
jgi:hypothetical protein